MKYVSILVLILLSFFIPTLPAQELEPEKDPFTLVLPVGYNLFTLDEQIIHNPSAGISFMYGKPDEPFDQVEKRFSGTALYMPLIFNETPLDDVPKLYHSIRGVFDGRLGRHQILSIFASDSDAPISGGLNTFRVAAGYGYQVVRTPHVSLIIGAFAVVGDLGFPSPVMPMPLVRFGIDTTWFKSSLDYVSGPNLSFTIAPKERIRFTANMAMESYRSIADLNGEFTLWYRLFSPDHKMGDFAGIGVGFKNEVTRFDLSRDSQADVFELQKSSVLATLDLSILTVKAGWVIDSNYLLDNKKSGSPGGGFFLSVQGVIPIVNRR